MATYNSNVWNLKFDSAQHETTTVFGKVAIPAGTSVTSSDTLNLFRARAGTAVVSFWWYTNQWATTQAQGTIGHYATATGSAIDAVSILADIDAEDADVAMSFADALAAPFPPVTQDYFVAVDVGTITDPVSAGEKYALFGAVLARPGDTVTPVYTWNGEASGSLSDE